MPKAPPAGSGSLSCLFAINKPTGLVSMTLLNKLQPLLASSALFANEPLALHPNDKGPRRRKWKDTRVKLGQGGTLDPLADGVLVIGTNGGTKKLSQFLECTKEYRAIGLFGCATDSYDSQGKRVKETGWDGVSREAIEAVLPKFRGPIEQVPPIFSALKMDGKPLYEYARNGIPLPRPIAARPVTVHELSLLSFTPGDEHTYEFPKEELDSAAKLEFERIAKMVAAGGTVVPDVDEPMPAVAPAPPVPNSRPPIFEISMKVSSGTYVRSIIHDIALALGSVAHVVVLSRTRQGDFTLTSPPSVSPPVAEPAPPSAAVEVKVNGLVPITEEPHGTKRPAPEVERVTPEGVESGDAKRVRIESETTHTAADPIPAAPPVVESDNPAEVAPEPAAVEPVVPVVAAAPEPAAPEPFVGGCVEWTLLKEALEELDRVKGGAEPTVMRNADGWLPWEQELLYRCKLV